MRRNFGEIENICILLRLNFIFQACITKSCLLLIMEPECRLKSAVRGYHIYMMVVVRETLPCVAESSNSSDRFAVAKI